MDNEYLIEPLSVQVPGVSSPPPLPPRRKLSPIPPPLPAHIFPGELGERTQADASLLTSNLEADEDELNEKELRELYDNEEIDRFLTLFSDYVTEVQAADAPDTTDTLISPPDLHENIPASEGEELTPIRSSEETSSLPSVTRTPSTTTSTRSKGLAAEIAYGYVLPILPNARPSPPPFTVGRLRVSAERIYLATLPVYGPFFSQLVSLATWEDGNISLIYCSIYWTLWWYNFLIPALVLRVIFALVKRRIFSHPSLEDLRRHREEVLCANEFGDQVSARLSATSTEVTEVIHLFKLFTKRRNKTAKQKAKDINSTHTSKDIGDAPLRERDMAVPEDTVDKEEAADIKRIAIYILNEIADLHERVKNIFLWRRPVASQVYGIVLFVLFLVTMLPAQVLSKLIFFILGFLFWHVVPVICSLAPSDKARLPPAFNDVPTDVEYAMALISQRVAAGLEIKPIKRDGLHQQGTIVESLLNENGRATENLISWKKWGNRVAFGKSAVSAITGLNPRTVGLQSTIETHTYPCQHRSAPGLITLTQDTMFFTPLLRQDAKIIIALTAIKGVKKVGMLKGLEVRWKDASGSKEDKFLWIGERDDLFARLVGSDGRRWIQI